MPQPATWALKVLPWPEEPKRLPGDAPNSMIVLLGTMKVRIGE